MLRRLAFIRAARNVGLTLDEVRAELAQLPADRAPTTADWRRISRGLAGAAEREDRRHRGAARPARLVHRLRLPVARRSARCTTRMIDSAAQAQPPGAALLPALLRRPVGGEAGRD